MRVITIVGARPQFIKASPVSRALRQQHTEILVHTGQHYDPDMSDVFFDELAIPRPDVNLGVGALSNLEQIAHMILALQPIALQEKPDYLLIYGDTNSTLAGALVGRALGIPVAHVEAGLRSYNRAMPEENNRVLTDHISSLLFCPTDVAQANLAREGITEGVRVVGDVMIDALLQNRARTSDRVLRETGVTAGEYFLATVHRPANTDAAEPLASIFAAFAALDCPVVLPAHPRLRKALERFAIALPANVIIIPPVGYLDMLSLSQAACVILTDSGGLQKEAYALGVPCVTMRTETEWVETVDAGWNRIVGADTGAISVGVAAALAARPAAHPDFYGDGHASERIIAALTGA
ncbi:MAG: UDP-N-acetylglucosamine 2-epimerase (non-hydrolyzing) [Chloroflexi bacterium]|nr:UDP-N-acetylglucosamine 2-epimerase (non-hydrolyzing) [Chloroflexota bacterium]